METLNAKTEIKPSDKTEYIEYNFNALVLLIVIFAITFFILGVTHPSWVEDTDPKTGNKTTNFGEVFLWSTIISILLVALVWVIKAFTGATLLPKEMQNQFK